MNKPRRRNYRTKSADPGPAGPSQPCGIGRSALGPLSQPRLRASVEEPLSPFAGPSWRYHPTVPPNHLCVLASSGRSDSTNTTQMSSGSVPAALFGTSRPPNPV